MSCPVLDSAFAWAASQPSAADTPGPSIEIEVGAAGIPAGRPNLQIISLSAALTYFPPSRTTGGIPPIPRTSPAYLQGNDLKATAGMFATTPIPFITGCGLS